MKAPINGNGNGGPWWSRLITIVGLNGFLVLFLLGAIPGLPSPFVTLNAAIAKHDETTKDQIRLLRLLCRSAWKDEPTIQIECDR